MQGQTVPRCRPAVRSPGALVAVAIAMLAMSSSPAMAQSDQLPLTGLAPPDSNAATAKKKKSKAKSKDTAPVAPAGPAGQADPGGAFVAAPPPVNKSGLPDVPMLNLSSRIGVKLVRSPLLDEATSADIESGMRGIAFQAPLAQNPIVLRVALDTPCTPDDDACFTAHAAPEGADTVVIAVAGKTNSGVSLRLRQISVFSKQRMAEAQGEAPADRASLKAEAEALICRMLVPAGCNGELQIDAGEADVLYQGRVLPKGAAIPMHATVPVGLAPLSAKLAGRAGAIRIFPVVREKLAGISLSVRTGPDGAPTLVTPAELEAISAPTAAVAEVQTAPSARARWMRPVGFGVAGAGAILLVTGVIEGLHSKSLLDTSQAAYNANGGTWKQSDLSTLNSGNSAAHTANILLLAGGIVAAAGLTLALAF